MPKQPPFPSKEADVNNYFILVVAYLLEPANATRLLVSGANQTLLASLLADWKNAYALTTNVDTHTKTATDNKNKIMKDLMTCLRSVYADIPRSAFTHTDRNTLNLQERRSSKRR